MTPAEFSELNRRVDALLAEHGRQPSDVRRSLMANVVFGRDDAEVQRTLDGRTAAELREQGIIVGTPAEIVDQIGQLAEAGVQRVMLQWLALDDLDGLEAMAQGILPQLR